MDMKALCEEFCRHSSLHGVHYLLGTVVERLIWSVLLTVVTVGLVVSLYSMWCDLFQGPVQVIVEDTQYDLNLVEFPALTVCPNSKAMRTKVHAIMETYVENKENYSAFENAVIAMSLMRYPFYNLPQDFVNSINESVYPIPSDNISDIMWEVGADLDDIMDHCKWRSVDYDCKLLFQQRITQEGYCYSFKSKATYTSKNDSQEKLPNSTIVSLKNNMYGRSSGLGFRLKSLAHESLENEILGDSYSCFIHNPEEIPNFTQVITILPNNPFKLFEISVSAYVLQADESLHKLKESVRSCVFASRTRSHCIMDCQNSIVLQYCRCVPFFLRNKQHHETVCSVQHLQCLSDIAPRLRNIKVSEGTPGFPEWSLPLTMNCSCLPLCSYTSYIAEMEAVPMSVTEYDKGWTKVRVVYKDFAIKYSATAGYVFRDFIIGCGSVASLLFGFSVVAVIHFIVYFFRLLNRGLILLLKSKVLNTFHHKTHFTRKHRNECVEHKKSIILKKDGTRNSEIITIFHITTCETAHTKTLLIAVTPKIDIDRPIYPFLN